MLNFLFPHLDFTSSQILHSLKPYSMSRYYFHVNLSSFYFTKQSLLIIYFNFNRNHCSLGLQAIQILHQLFSNRNHCSLGLLAIQILHQLFSNQNHHSLGLLVTQILHQLFFNQNHHSSGLLAIQILLQLFSGQNQSN